MIGTYCFGFLAKPSFLFINLIWSTHHYLVSLRMNTKSFLLCMVGICESVAKSLFETYLDVRYELIIFRKR